MEQVEQRTTNVNTYSSGSGLLGSVSYSDAILLELPFADILQVDVHALYGIQGYWCCYVDKKRQIQGNFVANSICRGIRTETRKLYGKTKRPDLRYIFQLPLELVMEIFASSPPQCRTLDHDHQKCHERWGVVNYAFGIDLCGECLDSETVTSSSFYGALRSLLPSNSYDTLTRALIPQVYKRIYLPNNFGTYFETRVHHSDAGHIMSQFTEHLTLTTVPEGIPVSSSRYDAFIAEAYQTRDYKKKIQRSLSHWREHHYKQCQSQWDDRIGDILNKFLEKLIAIGYEPEDVTEAKWHDAGLRIIERKRIRKADRKSFDRCRKELERLVLQVEEERMAFEMGSY